MNIIQRQKLIKELTSVSWKFPVKNTMIKPRGDYTNLYKQVIIEEKDFGSLTEYYKLVDGEYRNLIHLWIIDAEGKILIQRRSKEKNLRGGEVKMAD